MAANSGIDISSTNLNWTIAPGVTEYKEPYSFRFSLSSSSETNSSVAMPYDGTWSLLSLNSINNSLSTASITIQARVDGSNVNQNIVISAGTTGHFQDTSNTDSLNAGDLISLREVTAAGGSGTVTIDGGGWKYV